MRGRAAVLALAAIAVAISFAARGGGEPGSPARAGPGAILVRFVYSTEKTAFMAALVERFNASGPRVSGRPVFVDGSAIASGAAEQRIAAGTLKPVVWSPASSLWGRLLNYDADRTLAPASSPSLMRTPLVIAMWEPMARAMGWPRTPIGFGDLLRLARSRAGWGAYGRPDLGPFKLVHTNPDFSTSGLEAVVAEYYAATGRRSGLTTNDVTASRARLQVRDLERSIVHYGDTTPFVAERMRKEGTGYASAVAMEETTLLHFNRGRSGADRLVAVYPSEGTFFSDNPFMVLDAPWVRPEQARAAAAFQRFLLAQITPEVARRYFFQPAGSGPPAPGVATLSLPGPRVLAAIRRAWRRDRKPANIMLVVDTSASMEDEHRLDGAKEGLRAFLARVQPQDRLGLMAFSGAVRTLAPVAPVSGRRALLERMVAGLRTDAGTAIHDATAAAVGRVSALPTRAGHINAVVLLTDGQDTSSELSLDELLARLNAGRDDANRVRVYTIAYSAGAAGEAKSLARIAAASGGAAYTGSTGDIESIYTSISSFF
jgi:Ca-activated chloride channel family protein